MVDLHAVVKMKDYVYILLSFPNSNILQNYSMIS